MTAVAAAAAPSVAPPVGAIGPKSGSLYVGDLPQDLVNPEDTLFNLFNKIGMVMSIKVCRDINSQRSLGYAYVNFQNPADAERAMQNLNFTEVRPGRPIRIMWSVRDPAQRKTGSGNIFVKNLSPKIDARTLHDTFQVFGTVLSCKVAQDENGKSLGYGFVHFEKEESAKEAIDRVNNMMIGDQEVIVSPFIKKADRQREEEKVFTSIYVKNLKDSITEDDVKALLAPFGTINNIFVGGAPQYKTKFALVVLAKHESATEAITKLNATESSYAEPEFKLYVARALKKGDRQAQRARTSAASLYQAQGRNLYVKHIDDTVNDQQFEEMWAVFGEVTSCKLMRNPDGTPRGFGFVCFATKEGAQNAIREMNGKMLFRRPLYVSQAQNKDMRHHMLEEQRKAMVSQQQRMMMPMHNQFGMMGGPGLGFPGRGPVNPLGQPFPFGQPPGFGAPMMGPGGMRGPGGAPLMGPGGPQRMPPNPRLVRPPGPPGFPGAFPVAPFGGAQRYTQPPAPMPPRSQGASVSGLSSSELSKMSPEEQKNALGERLYVKIQEFNPVQAAKITGMLLEMDTPEILNVLEDNTILAQKVNEAVAVLRQHTEKME